VNNVMCFNKDQLRPNHQDSDMS